MTNEPGLEECGVALGKREEMSELTHKSLAGEPHGCYLHTCKDWEHGGGAIWRRMAHDFRFNITPFIHSQAFAEHLGYAWHCAGGQVQQS